MSRQVTTVKQVSFDSLFLYIYSNIHIGMLYEQVFFILLIH